MASGAWSGLSLGSVRRQTRQGGTATAHADLRGRRRPMDADLQSYARYPCSSVQFSVFIRVRYCGSDRCPIALLSSQLGTSNPAGASSKWSAGHPLAVDDSIGRMQDCADHAVPPSLQTEHRAVQSIAPYDRDAVPSDAMPSAHRAPLMRREGIDRKRDWCDCQHFAWRTCAEWRRGVRIETNRRGLSIPYADSSVAGDGAEVRLVEGETSSLETMIVGHAWSTHTRHAYGRCKKPAKSGCMHVSPCARR